MKIKREQYWKDKWQADDIKGCVTNIMDYFDRQDKIVEYCNDKTVLDLGCIMHDEFEWRLKKGEYLHEKIVKIAKKVVGIDYLEQYIPMLKEKGYDIRYGDVEHLEAVELNETFDVIVAGELIEHLSNPGLFLEGVKRFMHDQSILILTTPNPFHYVRRNLLLKGEEKEWLNKEHSCWFSFQTLKQLLERHGYDEVKYWYYGENWRIGSIKKLIHGIIRRRYKKIPHLQEGLFFVAKLSNNK